MAVIILAASPRLNCAKTGLAANDSRQDSAKPRETFIRTYPLAIKKPLRRKRRENRGLDWGIGELFHH
jgi:hypothetical protein